MTTCEVIVRDNDGNQLVVIRKRCDDPDYEVDIGGNISVLSVEEMRELRQAIENLAG